MRQIFLDSSVILSYFKSRDAHHKDVVSLLEFIKNKYADPYALTGIYLINDIVMMEVVSKLIHDGHGYSKANRMIDRFTQKYGVVTIKRTQTLDKVRRAQYGKYSRNKIRKLQSNDFIIASDVLDANSLLATCDGDFMKAKSANFDVYFVSSKSKKYKDQYSKLLTKFLDSV